MIKETPLLFPGLEATPRYIIDAESKRLVRSRQGSSAETSSSSLSPPNVYLQQPLDSAISGAASVSSIQLHSRSNHASLVTTCALVESPNVINVALSWKVNTLESPLMVELDTQDLQPVAIRAFELEATPSSMDVDGSVGKFKLVLIGSNGTIVSLIMDEHLTADTSYPLIVLSTQDYMHGTLLDQVGNAELQTSMVSFLSSNHIIVALAPLILTIDLIDGKAEAWSETQCLEDMKSRASFLTGFIGRVLGRVEGAVVDMPQTAALCVSTNFIEPTQSPDEDATVSLVFTLHSDASVRKWRIDLETSLLPIEVTILTDHTAHKKLAVPSTWSDTNKSIALCARIYDGMFALAVHIRTNTLSSYDQGVSDCNLWVFHGHETEQPVVSFHALTVPNDATSMVGMYFAPNHRRCTLSATFAVVRDADRNSSSGRQGLGTVLMVKYPPSLISIVALEPEIVEMVSLDQIAATERNRIQALCFGASVLMEETQSTGDESHATHIAQVLHKLDVLYLKALFRPIFPRGNGTALAPSDTCIRRALSKLVHGATKERVMSIELETIKTLCEWRYRDKNKSTATTLSPTKQNMQRRKMVSNNNSTVTLIEGADQQSLSVYDSFVGPDEVEEGTLLDNMDPGEEMDQLEEELVTEIEAHENRWRRLLYQIWEEEHILRTPLFVYSLDSQPIHVVIRGAVTTMLSNDLRSGPSDQKPWAAKLDEAACHMLRLIESNQKKSNALCAIEERVVVLVSRAQLAISPKISISDDLTSLGRWARLQDDGCDDVQLKQMIKEIPVGDLVAWVQTKPAGMGALLPHRALNSEGVCKRVANCQLRHAACSSVIRAIDLLRRSRLGKCLLLLEVTSGSHATTAAFRSYLESIALLWSMGQIVKIPATAFPTIIARKKISNDSKEIESLSTQHTNHGGASSPTTTTLVDAVILEIFQSVNESLDTSSSPNAIVLHMVESYLDRLFLPTVGRQSARLPELNVLPFPHEDYQSTAYPELALRLLAPFAAYPIPEDLPETVIMRKETLAACLLHSSHSSKSLSTLEKSRMREIACDLLVPKNPDNGYYVDKDTISVAVDSLDAIRDKSHPGSVDNMKKQLHLILPDCTSIEIGRLCEIRSAQTMFLTFDGVSSSSLDENSRTAVEMLARVMLNMSRVLHRLATLETYMKRADDDMHDGNCNSQSLLIIIADAIAEMENNFPAHSLKKMPEYTSLWSKKFQHAVLACSWSQAYDACVWNPVAVHREINFKHLVHAMVNSGALSDLLGMCTEVGIRSSVHDGLESQSVDLYEISAEVLLSYAKSRDMYDKRATSSGKSSNLPDFQGALYAIHASQEQWRRAAQSLDLRYLNAENALRRSMGNTIDTNIQSSELRDSLIVEDLVLASCGSANAIELVRNPAHRFIVSGEYGPYSVIPIDDGDANGSASTFNRSRFQNATDSALNPSLQKEDRLSKFLTRVEFEGRAVRCIAIRALFFDRSTAYSSAKSAFLREFDSSNQDVNELFKNGYFQLGLLLAKSWSKDFETKTGSTKPAGQDLFGSCVAQMGYNLVTLSCTKGDYLPRPTLQQLHIAIDTVGSIYDSASYVVTGRCSSLSSLEHADYCAAALLLIQMLTLSYNTVEIPLAVDIGKYFLDIGDQARLPIWLERLLIGADAQSSENGLFAPRPSAGSGTFLGAPSALLTMYIERGMLLDACCVVISVLKGFGRTDSRASKAPNRLPEVGDIDFVPYQNIDLLWNVIEIAISKGVYNKEEKAEILQCRGQMEEALKKHFEYMRISEMGMRSARLLLA
jgi:hypothetical protein